MFSLLYTFHKEKNPQTSITVRVYNISFQYCTRTRSTEHKNYCSVRLLSCHHYFKTAVHTFSSLALTFLATFSTNAISWANQIQSKTDSTGFPPHPPLFLFCFGFSNCSINRSQKTHQQEVHFLHCLNNACGFNMVTKRVHQLLYWSFSGSTAIMWFSELNWQKIN